MNITNRNIDDELNDLLGESIYSSFQRSMNEFNKIYEMYNKNIILLGSGNLGKKIYSSLKKNGIYTLSFIDNNPNKWGQTIDGIKILKPKDAAEKYGESAIFVVCIWSPRHSFLKTKEHLIKLGCKKIIHFSFIIWRFPEDILPHYQFETPYYYLLNSEQILYSFKLLSDYESKRQYLQHIRFRLKADLNNLPIPSFNNQYFPEEIIKLTDSESFVDCGAYDGDTLKIFLNIKNEKFNKYYAFEPDSKNFLSLIKYINNLPIKLQKKITAINAAVGRVKGNILFNCAGGMNSSISNLGDNEVNIFSLDDEIINGQPTFLKFDIEGQEKSALIGSIKIISQLNPIIAVCIYHMPNDLWKIPILLKKLNSTYSFFIRTHDEDGLEIVLYAIPKNRLR